MLAAMVLAALAVVVAIVVWLALLAMVLLVPRSIVSLGTARANVLVAWPASGWPLMSAPGVVAPLMAPSSAPGVVTPLRLRHR